MNFVVNVDDLGLHPAVRRAVEVLAEKGVVTSGSVLAAGMDMESCLQLEGISLGIHLDILRGRPLSHWQHVNTLVDDNGAFLNDPVKLFRLYAAGKVDHAQVEREWRAQIERVWDLGLRPTHLTSHKHVHAWPSLTRIAAELAERYYIDWIRKPVECSEIARLDKSGVQSKFLNVCGFFDRELSSVKWTDMFWDAEVGGVPLSPKAFRKDVEQCDWDRQSVVELCCVPGVTIAGDPPIPLESNPPALSARWRSEFRSLAEDDWFGTARAMEMSFASYDSL